MNIESLLILIGIALAAAGFGTSAIIYMRLAPWYEEPIGRWFVGLLWTLTAVLGLVAVNRLFNGEITRTVWAFLAITLAVVAWGICVTITRTQHRVNAKQDQEQPRG